VKFTQPEAGKHGAHGEHREYIHVKHGAHDTMRPVFLAVKITVYSGWSASALGRGKSEHK
jgi:hypothetical protein